LNKQYYFDCCCSACTTEKDGSDFRCTSTRCKGARLKREGAPRCLLVCPECGVRCEEDELHQKLQLAEMFYLRGRQLLDSLQSAGEEDDTEQTLPNAVKCFGHSLRIRKEVLHPLHKTIAQSEDAMAQTFGMLSNYTEAARHCENSIRILEQIFEKFSTEVGEEYYKLATLWFNAGDAQRAGQAIDEACRILLALHGPQHPPLAHLASMRSVLPL